MKNVKKNNFEEFLTMGIIIIGLSIHLFTIHSKMLYHLNPDKIIEFFEYSFTMDLFSVKQRVSTISAITYSLITAVILWKFTDNWKFFIVMVTVFAILDGLGVRVYYNANIKKDLFMHLGSLYYAVYTAVMIISIGVHRMNKTRNNELNNNIDKAIGENDVIQLRKDMHKIMNNSIKIGDWDIKTIEEKIIQLKNEGLSQLKIAKELSISQPKVSRILSKIKEENE